jgi:hypothetical protein
MDIQEFLIRVLNSQSCYSEKIAILLAASFVYKKSDEQNALRKAIEQYQVLEQNQQRKTMVFGEQN